MREFLLTLLIFSVSLAATGYAKAEIKIQQLGNGWIGFANQSDPFDNSIVTISQISKGGFYFRCGDLNMSVDSYGYESLSFNADIKYMIDEDSAQDRTGKYSTYLGGSDLVTDSRYYSFRINEEDIKAMKSGLSMKVAGKYSNGGWQTKVLDLHGFNDSYSKMCNK